ncbi:MAG: HD domain-containing phosphohydrolase [Bacillota bacterium]|nr:HD domain-containing phosphohydrolase [Bacillota bacterium]
MVFNLNEFLTAISFALDFVEIDILGANTNHGKRTAYMALKIAEELGFSSEELHDIAALAILHDNGVSEKSLFESLNTEGSSKISELELIKEHCTIGEENIKKYPFLTDVRNVIKYHHERYDGSGFFSLNRDEIPVMSQIIEMADVLEMDFDIQNNSLDTQNNIFRFIKEQENRMFSTEIANAFRNAAQNKAFWMDLKNLSIDSAIRKSTPQYVVDLPFEKIQDITQIFSKIIDSKSKYTQRHSRDLSEKVAIMADFYGIKDDERLKLIIAANLHDIGKLAVPNAILDRPNKLTKYEFEVIKEHTYYTRMALQEIKGFEEITEWASNHHEKLNGLGYPYGKNTKDLDFNSRLVACLDIYEALTEERPYRESLKHGEAMNILNGMKYDGLIDSKITDDIGHVFKSI